MKMSQSDPPDLGSARSRGNDRVSVIRSVTRNNHITTYESDGNSNYCVDNHFVDNNSVSEDEGDDDCHGDNNDIAAPAGSKKAVYMTKKRKIEEKMAERQTKRMLYNAAVEDMKNNAFPSFNSCAKTYGLSHTTLKRLCDSGGEYIGHNKSNRVCNY